MMRQTIKCFIVFIMIHNCMMWDSDDFEIFDAVEEINRNFYELMGISQTASLTEVKKAYRSLSKQLHPDKSDAPDADVQFRQLVSAYEILRDENKRERYNKVLVEGIPDWRSPIYYYRRARKMSLLEIGIILTVVISISQYLMAWGSYLDRRHTLEDFLLRKFKVQNRKRKKPEDLENLDFIDEQLSKVEKPKWWRILPIQLVQLIIFLFMNGPKIVMTTFENAKEKRKLEEEKLQLEKEEEQRMLEEEEKRKEKKALLKQRKKVKKVEEYVELIHSRNRNEDDEPTEHIPMIIGGMWTDDDFSDLSRLMAKYPGGTSDRWEKIASQMNRTVYEVTKMSGKVKDMLTNRIATEGIPQVKVKVKTKAKTEENAEGDQGNDEMWSTLQQKALEKALKKYPKGTDLRWDKISSCVPDKSKEECMLRFKCLAEKIRKKKEQEVAGKDDLESSEKTVEEGTEINLDDSHKSEYNSLVKTTNDTSEECG